LNFSRNKELFKEHFNTLKIETSLRGERVESVMGHSVIYRLYSLGRLRFICSRMKRAKAEIIKM
jgi:hypothetical protein